MSDYDWLVDLAAKGMAERDNHPMPPSVTTPEAFYQVMARSALDAIGLQALLEDLARAEEELKTTEESADLAAEIEVATTIPEEPAVSSQTVQTELSVPSTTCIVSATGVRDARSRPGRKTEKAENARLRRK